MTRGIITALSISLLIHGLLFYFLFTSVKLDKSPLAAKNELKKPIVQSYIYHPPKPKIIEPIDEKKQTAKPETKVEQKLVRPAIKAKNTPAEKAKITDIKTAQDVTKTKPSSVKPLNTPIEKPITEAANSAVSKELATPNKSPNQRAVFNPYKAGQSINDLLDQQMFEQHFEQRSNSQGISEMQQAMPSVPERVYKKTAEETREEATTQVGNETFVKQDGTCTQTTDLGFIDDNLGKVTSFSNCGETDDERYFREFMAKKLKHLQKKK